MKNERLINYNQYIANKTILLELGLSVAWDKCIPPTRRILTWTGTTFDKIQMIIWIEVEKVLDLCQTYIHKLPSLLSSWRYL